MADEELDGPGVIKVKDHPYVPADYWWSKCKHCGLAEASHLQTLSEGMPLLGKPYRCPRCVNADSEFCIHTHEEVDEMLSVARGEGKT